MRQIIGRECTIYRMQSLTTHVYCQSRDNTRNYCLSQNPRIFGSYGVPTFHPFALTRGSQLAPQ